MYQLLNSGVSQRRAALLLRVNRKTVVRKFLKLSDQARRENCKERDFRVENSLMTQVKAIHFDEMESSVHSKCLPVSIPLVVEPVSRKILGFRVGTIPAKGPLAEISRKKYGPRSDERPEMIPSLLEEIKPLLQTDVLITTDQNPHYPEWLRMHFPQATHRTVKGKRGCVVGQGELKRVGFDPLFDLNHTAAMIRANVNRMFRRTWCTSKRMDRLEAHLHLYVHYHNQVLT